MSIYIDLFLSNRELLKTLTNDLYNYPLLEEGAQRNLKRIREIEEILGLEDEYTRRSYGY